MAPNFQFDHPDSALSALAEKLAVIDRTETTADVIGRVLASPVVADRDSPAADVSAMDGYAVRISELQVENPVPVVGESAPGAPPPTMPSGAAIRIFTGAIVPPEADLVIKREDTKETDTEVHFLSSALQCEPGEHIRRAGENAKSGSTVLPTGTRVSTASRATMANFGCDEANVYSPVRVSIITTGDEVGVEAGVEPQPWQLRNSNRASLTGLLSPVRWIRLGAVDHAIDDREALASILDAQLSQSDAVLLTGGVSMGNYDYVPDVIREAGGEIVFHGLPLRPGKPILGAVTSNGKLIMGLPGNPVSATVGCRRMALPLLAKISGQSVWQPPCPVVRLTNPDEKTIPLHWMKLARLVENGSAEVVVSQGSGDLVSLGQSTGFVEVAAGESGEGPWPYYDWIV